MADTGLVYGNTATGKSTNLGFAIPWMYETTGGRTGRLINTDAQGLAVYEPLIDAGFVEAYNLLTAEAPEFALRKLAEGWWPDSTGKLVPPAPGALSRVGFYVTDTISGGADCLLEKLRADGRQIGQDVVGKWTLDIGGTKETFCNNPPAHYGWVQREILSWIKAMAGLPVPYLLYAAHEAQGETEDTRAPIRGPAIVGKAATAKVPKELGFSIHMEAYTSEVETTDPVTKAKIKRSEPLVRAFFVNHPDPTLSTVMYNCNARVPPEAMPLLRAEWPDGYFVPTLEHGLDLFMAKRAEAIRAVAHSKRQMRAEMDAAARQPDGGAK